MTPSAPARVVILTKVPVPGTVKTRLIPALGAERACHLHAAMVVETLRVVRQADLPATISLAGPPDHPFAARLRADGWLVEPQTSGDLGARLRHALRGPGRRIALGTDCPLLQPEWLQQAARHPAPVQLGPADDGGYWAVAVDAPLPVMFEDIPWSTERVLSVSLDRARAAGLAVSLLPRCYDIDEPASLARLRADPLCPPSLWPLLAALPLP